MSVPWFAALQTNRPKEVEMTQQDARAIALKVLAELAENATDEGIRLGAATQLALTTKTE